MTDLAKEGTFQWGTDFSGLKYTNWHRWEPNGGIFENCVLLYHNQQWEDYDCNANTYVSNVHALCEKPHM